MPENLISITGEVLDVRPQKKDFYSIVIEEGMTTIAVDFHLSKLEALPQCEDIVEVKGKVVSKQWKARWYTSVVGTSFRRIRRARSA